MSNVSTGADIQALTELSADYKKTGDAMLQDATDLNKKISSAIEEFNSKMNELEQRAGNETAQIQEELRAVRAQADSVEWTGNNRLAFNNDLATFGAAVQSGTQVIDTDIAELKSSVSVSFAQSLSEFASGLGKRMAENTEAANLTSKSTATLAEDLDRATNASW